MEITKIRMQMQMLLPAAERQSTMEVVKGMGLRGLYSGTLATLSRDVPFSILFFPGYANLKALMADEKGNNSVTTQLLAGGIAGAVGAGAVTPTDVVKTRFAILRKLASNKILFELISFDFSCSDYRRWAVWRSM